jgi:beta-glucosidase
MHENIKASHFGDDFKWGVSTAAYQIEGAYKEDGKGQSIWDTFSNRKGKIKSNHNGNVACDYYHRFTADLDILQSLGINNYRFSLSWSRILPQGFGAANNKGIDFYKRVIDACLTRNITPWITLYHWDLPQALQDKGGWTNREILDWFGQYTTLCVNTYGDTVKNWMILNEPLVFTGAGYFLGIHAPGKKGPGNFLSSVHHAALCQAEGGRIVKQLLPGSFVGSTFSCAPVYAVTPEEKNIKAAARIDAMLNRLFLEPALGLGYPLRELPFLKRIEKYFKAGDDQRLQFDFDFHGIQNYTREVVKHSMFTPFLQAKLISAQKRNVATTAMGWEIFPQSVYIMLKQFSNYKKIKQFIITESGIGLHDVVENGLVNDTQRRHYIMAHLQNILIAKKEGIPVSGFFNWTLLDNFEWAEGYHPRFGLVHVDFETQQRTIKNSAHWFSKFLK